MRFKFWRSHTAGQIDDEHRPEDTVHRLSRLSGEEELSEQAITRGEYKATGRGRYPLDPVTRKLTPEGKRLRLKRRLNITMITLVLLIIVVYLIFFFV